MKVVCIHQPDFLPYLGFCERLMKCETFIILDHVQFEKRGWQNRNRIKTSNGWMWITVPVINKGRYGQSLLDVEIDSEHPWKRRHLQAIATNYGASPYFAHYYQLLKKIYEKDWRYLVDFNMALFYAILEELKLELKIFRSSEMKSRGKSSELLANLVKEAGGSVYLCGPGGKNYLEEDIFSKLGIKVVYQRWTSPYYPQLFGEFIPDLSVLDALMNYGEKIRNLLGA